jgi:hypothetical protein
MILSCILGQTYDAYFSIYKADIILSLC